MEQTGTTIETGGAGASGQSASAAAALDGPGAAPSNESGSKSRVCSLKKLTPFSEAITGVSGEIINRCYQCKKCSAGCPVAFAMDILPHQVIKMIQLGMEKEVLSSNTIWLCAACETCGTRCPNEIMLSDMFDALRQRALAKKVRVGERKVPVFHESFLDSVRRHGRVYELGMIRRFMLKSGGIVTKLFNGGLINDALLGLKLFIRGKLKLFPHRIKKRKEIKAIFRKSA